MHLREDGAMEDVETREASTEATVGAEVRDDGLWLGDAIDFFLSAKRAGGRSEKTVDGYRKKLELFQRWLAVRLGGEDALDAPYISVGPDLV
jgi:hypothetical protein